MAMPPPVSPYPQGGAPQGGAPPFQPFRSTTGGSSSSGKEESPEHMEADRILRESEDKQIQLQAQAFAAEDEQRRIELAAQEGRDKAEREHQEKIAKEESDREKAIEGAYARQKKLEEDVASKRENQVGWWDTLSGPKRIFAALLVGANSAAGGRGADIFKEQVDGWREKQENILKAAEARAAGAGADAKQLEKLKDDFHARRLATEAAREKDFKRQLDMLSLKNPKIAAEHNKLLGEMKVQADKRRLETKELLLRTATSDYHTTTVTGTKDPMATTSSGAPNVTDVLKLGDLKGRKDSLDEATAALADPKNAKAMAELIEADKRAASEKAAGGAGKTLNELLRFTGIKDPTPYTSLSSEAKDMKLVRDRAMNELAQITVGIGNAMTDDERADQQRQLELGATSPERYANVFSKLSKRVDRVLAESGAAMAAKQGLPTSAAPAPAARPSITPPAADTPDDVAKARAWWKNNSASVPANKRDAFKARYGIKD